MPKWTLEKCFRAYGAVGSNPRWSWSARSADGNTVVLTLWKDVLKVVDGKATYDNFGRGSDKWLEKPGNRERLENLRWAVANCGGEFRVVITVAVDPNASPRAIAECYPQERLRMKITELQEETGEFRAVSI